MEQKNTVLFCGDLENSGILPDSVVIWTFSVPDQKLVYLSPNVEELTGYKVSDFYLNPKLWLDLIQSYDAPSLTYRIIGDDLAFEYVYTIKDKNGNELKIKDLLFPLVDENEQLIQVQIYSEFERVSSFTIENSSTPFFEAKLDEHLNIQLTKVSKRLCEILDCYKSKLNSQLNRENILQSIISEKISELIINKNIKFEFCYPENGDNKTFLFEVLLNTDGKNKKKIYGYAIDITELKLNEQRLQKINSDKNKLLAIVSHDLKAPLNTIINFINLLNEGIEIEEEQKREYLRYIYETAKQRVELIHDLLDWSKVEAGLLEFTPQFLKLQKILNKIISGFGGQIYQKNIKVIYDFDKDFKVFFDKNYLKIVLTNLISNAIKFSHKNGKIIIAAQDENDFSSITIKDFGIGFSDRYLKQMTGFPDFAIQVGTMGEKGTGFGLRFCYDIIHSNHGKLMIETETQKGTNVIVKLRKPQVKVVYFDEENKLNELKTHIAKFQPDIFVYLCKDVFDLFNFIKEVTPEFLFVNFDLIKTFQKSFIERVFFEVPETSKVYTFTSNSSTSELSSSEIKIDEYININMTKKYIITFLENLQAKINH